MYARWYMHGVRKLLLRGLAMEERKQWKPNSEHAAGRRGDFEFAGAVRVPGIFVGRR